MSEKIEFIPAKDLPVAEGDEVDVLCMENGELKRKEGASIGGGVQPDWNQNDETAPDYVKNRPFYVEERESVILEGQLEVRGDMAFITVINDLQPSDGQPVTIVFNGEQHDLTLVYDLEADVYFATLPNGNILEVWLNNDEWSWNFYGSNAGTVSVLTLAKQVKKLDSEYLPFGMHVSETFGKYVKLPFYLDDFIVDCGNKSFVFPSVSETMDIYMTRENFDVLLKAVNSDQYIPYDHYANCFMNWHQASESSFAVRMTKTRIIQGVVKINDYIHLLQWDEDNGTVKLIAEVKSKILTSTDA